MRQAWWKRALSHFSDVQIESVDSEVNPGLYVCLSKGRYQLCVNNAIYSFEDKYDNYWDVFQQIDLGRLEGKEILILGFGMGSIPRMLEKMGVRARFTGVEYDEAVAYLYNKYLGDEVDSYVEIINGDAEIFMNLNERKFDLIAMDVFVEDEIPDRFKTDSFMTKLKESLRPDGLLIWNHLYHYEKDRELADQFYNKEFRRIFESGSFIRTSGNKMMLNKNIVSSRVK